MIICLLLIICYLFLIIDVSLFGRNKIKFWPFESLKTLASDMNRNTIVAVMMKISSKVKVPGRKK